MNKSAITSLLLALLATNAVAPPFRAPPIRPIEPRPFEPRPFEPRPFEPRPFEPRPFERRPWDPKRSDRNPWDPDSPKSDDLRLPNKRIADWLSSQKLATDEREQLKRLENRAKVLADWIGVQVDKASVLSQAVSVEPEQVLSEFFTYLIGNDGLESRSLAGSLAKFGRSVSRQFCTDFLRREASSWLTAGNATEGLFIKEPTFENLWLEHTRLNARLREFARERCIDWPVEVWSNDQRLAEEPDTIRSYPGRIVLQKVSEFKIVRNRYPKAHIVLRTSNDPSKGLASLTVVPKGFNLVFDAPHSMVDAVRIYGDAELPLSWAHQSKYFEASLTALGGRSVSKLRADPTGEKSTMANLVLRATETKKPDEVLCLVAHCDNGYLRFSDGSQLPVSKVRQQDALDSPVIIIACDTLTHFGNAPGLKFATARSISYDEAINNVKAIRSAVEEQKPIGEAFRGIQMDELKDEQFNPNPANPSTTGQATIQLVDASNNGVITIHSESMVLASVDPWEGRILTKESLSNHEMNIDSLSRSRSLAREIVGQS